MSGRAVQRDNPTYNIETVSRVYANINEELGDDWDDVEHWEIPTSSPEPYEIVDWVGAGKYSDVFTAYRQDTGNKLYAIKCLKPVRPSKYVREAKILFNLRGGPNIINTEEIVKNPNTGQLSLVFENVQESDYSQFFSNMNPTECCLYLYQLMRALQYAHSHGIMHRDVKPLNVLYERKTKKLRLIDWGLAEFYHPGQKYNIHVASRHFKPPELLLDYQLYDYSIDIWSFGVTMAGMVFKQTPFFRGTDDFDMVAKIVNVLGREKLTAYLNKYGIQLPPDLSHMAARNHPRAWNNFVNEGNKAFATEAAIDLIDKCLKFDHMERITADEALQHPYFDPVRDIPTL